jgi:hypothetical protein
VRNIHYLMLLSFILLLSACDERKTTLSPQELYGTIRISFDDSFHLSDSTVDLAAAIDYNVASQNGLFNRGTYEIPASSMVGDIHRLTLDRVAAGSLMVHYTVTRPFILLGRKDDISRARFSDSVAVFLLPNGSIDVGTVDIWAFRLNRLIVHFDPDITMERADAIIDSLGAGILGIRRSIFDNGLIYQISTQSIGPESDIKPMVEAIQGVTRVYFDVIGHAYL